MGEIESRYILGQYLPNQTVIHRIDPRAKLLAGMLFTGSIFAIQSWLGYLILGANLVCVIWLSKIRLSHLWKGLGLPLWFALLSFLLHSFTYSGQALWSAMGLVVTYEGLIEGIKIGLRIIFLGTTGIVLSATTSSIELTTALEVILMPLSRFKVPVRALALMMGMTLRFIPILLEEAENLKRAQLSRGGFWTEGSLSQRFQTLYAMAIPLIVLTVKRADYLAQAMEARGFGVNGYTIVKAQPLQLRDYISLLIIVTVIILSYSAKYWEG